jgi:hypothetical protein
VRNERPFGRFVIVIDAASIRLSAATCLVCDTNGFECLFLGFLQVDVDGACAAIRDWTIAQIPGGTTDLDQLICDGKTLCGSIEPTSGGGSAFIAQVTLYSAALGVAIAQACYATGENHEGVVLQKLLGGLDLEGVLIQADALHIQQSFFGSSRSRGPTCC